VIHKEPGGELVEPLLATAALSAVNWSETYAKLQGSGLDARAMRADVEEAGVEIVAFDTEDAERAADLIAATQPLGLSLADRACLALAARLNVSAVTADRAWADVDVGVAIHCIR